MNNRMKGQSPYIKELDILVESRVNFKRRNSVYKNMEGWKNMGIV